ncbi:RING-H2 finger protein ATL51-like [Cornus florida]|uniref:RING-H2 finger protein ATL51-like n=1 Tax=Cornus florida TaxID=4283 RepID=UPI0028969936|nr:RING-H2 finger protein ATL51-like [Cornus florida]XP_059654307.1 RING-H2 finger protein ATL51-like [Cornus florida]XP_059654308.1 RING-H2 finger protein ATL51-like [Cornus florida]
MVGQEWHLDREVYELQQEDDGGRTSEMLGMAVHVQRNRTVNFDYSLFPACALESDETARSFFSPILERMRVTVDMIDRICPQLLSFSRFLNNDRTGIPHTAIPVVILAINVDDEVESDNESQAMEEEESSMAWAMDESMEEDYGALQLVPATQSSLDALKEMKFDSSGSIDHCSICLEMFCHEDLITSMPCSHPYHGICIHRWLKTSHYCPLCRFEMET